MARSYAYYEIAIDDKTQPVPLISSNNSNYARTHCFNPIRYRRMNDAAFYLIDAWSEWRSLVVASFRGKWRKKGIHGVVAKSNVLPDFCFRSQPDPVRIDKKKKKKKNQKTCDRETTFSFICSTRIMFYWFGVDGIFTRLDNCRFWTMENRWLVAAPTRGRSSSEDDGLSDWKSSGIARALILVILVCASVRNTRISVYARAWKRVHGRSNGETHTVARVRMLRTEKRACYSPVRLWFSAIAAARFRRNAACSTEWKGARIRHHRHR